MLASGLPICSARAGALPETAGFSGGAYLADNLSQVPSLLIRLLVEPRDPARAREAAVRVRDRYNLDRILNEWERLLASAPEQFSTLPGSWNARKGVKYLLKRGLGMTGLGAIYQHLRPAQAG
jgi:hypothetical protein